MGNTRQRVCAAIIRDDSILMVHHRHDGRSYWTLPGGGVEADETPRQAIIREVREETGLRARVIRFLFEEPYLNGDGVCRCFLLETEGQEAVTGADPEEAHLKAEDRMLQGIGWHELESVRHDRQVSKVIEALSRES